MSADAPGDRPRYFAWLYTPRDARASIAALFELERQLADSTRPGVEHTVAHARAAWWQEELDRLGLGVPRHPLTCLLLERARALGAAPPMLAEIMQNVRWDLAGAAPLTRDDVDAYASHWARSLFRTAVALATDTPDRPVQDLFVQQVGASLCELEQLGRLRADAQAGLIRWPVDDLETMGLRHDALGERPLAPPLLTALLARVEALEATAARGVAALPQGSAVALRGLIVWLTVAARVARRELGARDSRDHASRHQTVRATFGDAYTSWRVARRAINAPVTSTDETRNG